MVGSLAPRRLPAKRGDPQHRRPRVVSHRSTRHLLLVKGREPQRDLIFTADMCPYCQPPEEVLLRMREAIEFHLEGMRLNGEVVPEPTVGGVAMGENAQSARR